MVSNTTKTTGMQAAKVILGAMPSMITKAILEKTTEPMTSLIHSGKI